MKNTGMNLSIIAATAFVCATVFGCTFNKPDNTALTMTPVGTWVDTVTTTPSFAFALSRPITDTVVTLKLDPAASFGGDLCAKISPTCDTLFFDVPVGSTILSGSTTYTISPSTILHSATGKTLDPSGAVFSFTTYPSESGQNITPAKADTFSGKICGQIYPSSDTDYFYVASPAGQTLSITSSGEGIVAMALDTMGTWSDTLASSAGLVHAFSSKAKSPLTIAVVSINRTSASYLLFVGKP